MYFIRFNVFVIKKYFFLRILDVLHNFYNPWNHMETLLKNSVNIFSCRDGI